MANITTAITVRVTASLLLTLNPHSLKIVRNIHIDKNTLPKYVISFATMAKVTVSEIESRKYPTLTMAMQI